MVLTEAFPSGTPVIASAIAGYSDVVTDGVDGVLVPPADAQRLAEELQQAHHEPERLLGQSPLTHAAGISTPLLILHSEGDLRCPIEQAEQLFAALKNLGCEVELVRYPREANHGLSRSGPPDLRLDRLERIAAWMERWLMRGE